jgi:hypothetical protein
MGRPAFPFIGQGKGQGYMRERRKEKKKEKKQERRKPCGYVALLPR